MSDFVRAFEFIERANGVADLSALQQEIGRALLEFGVTQFSLLGFARPPGGKARRPVALSQACDRAWSARYLERRYFNSDAVVHTALRTARPFVWDDLNLKTWCPTAETIMDEGLDQMKVRGGMTVPTHDAQGFAGMITMFYADERPNAEQQRALRLIAIYAVERAKELAGVETDQTGWDTGCPLTNRQREMLAWSAIGKTDGDIAAILGIAEKTANRHFERAKSALGVATRPQAVAIAVHQGWIAL